MNPRVRRLRRFSWTRLSFHGYWEARNVFPTRAGGPDGTTRQAARSHEEGGRGHDRRRFDGARGGRERGRRRGGGGGGPRGGGGGDPLRTAPPSTSRWHRSNGTRLPKPGR